MVENLMFDLGGVIMDIKKENCVEAFKTLGLPDTKSFFGEYGQKGPFGDIEEGNIGVEEFHKIVRDLIPGPVTDREIDEAFMKFLIGIPVERLRQLQLLRQKYGIYLLSNTNPIMWEGKIKEDFCKDGLNIEAYFDGITTSFRAHSLKPAAEIFDYAERTMGIKRATTLFLDDSLENVKAAEALGFQGAHVKPGEEFYTILQGLNLA